MSDTQYDWKNLTPAQQLAAKSTGMTYEWMVKFASHVLPGIVKMAEAILKYDAAADKFIDKVDIGRARSVETYNDLKLAREASKALNG